MSSRPFFFLLKICDVISEDNWPLKLDGIHCQLFLKFFKIKEVDKTSLLPNDPSILFYFLFQLLKTAALL